MMKFRWKGTRSRKSSISVDLLGNPVQRPDSWVRTALAILVAILIVTMLFKGLTVVDCSGPTFNLHL